jgi:hypothetical protein
MMPALEKFNLVRKEGHVKKKMLFIIIDYLKIND